MSKYTSIGATVSMTVSATSTSWAELDPMAKALRIVRVAGASTDGVIFLKFAPAQYNYSTNTVIALNSSSFVAATTDYPLPSNAAVQNYDEVIEISGQAAVYALGGAAIDPDTVVYITELT